MAFADPQTITINAVPFTLNRTGTGENTGTLSTADANLKLSIKHQFGKRYSSVLRLDHRKVAVDPMIAAQNLLYSTSISVVVNRPPVGYTPAELKQIWDGLLVNLAATSGANTTKFLGFES